MAGVRGCVAYEADELRATEPASDDLTCGRRRRGGRRRRQGPAYEGRSVTTLPTRSHGGRGFGRRVRDSGFGTGANPLRRFAICDLRRELGRRCERTTVANLTVRAARVSPIRTHSNRETDESAHVSRPFRSGAAGFFSGFFDGTFFENASDGILNAAIGTVAW